MMTYEQIKADVKAGKYKFSDSAAPEKDQTQTEYEKIKADVKAGKYTFEGFDMTRPSEQVAKEYNTAVEKMQEEGRSYETIALGRQAKNLEKDYAQLQSQWEDLGGDITWDELSRWHEIIAAPGLSEDDEATYNQKLQQWQSMDSLRKQMESVKTQISGVNSQQQDAFARNYMALDLEEFKTWSQEDQNQMMRYIAHSDATGKPDDLSYAISMDKLAAKYGKDTFKRIAESVRLNQAMLADEEAEKAGKASKGVLGTIGSIPAGWIGGVQGTVNAVGGTLADWLGAGTGRYGAMPYAAGNYLSTWAENVQAATAEDAGKKTAEVAAKLGASEEIQEALGSFSSGAYQVLVSAADNMGRAVITGGIGTLALAATTSFSQSYRQAAENGATPSQAAAMGVVSGFLEVATEKIPLDNLFRNLANTGDKSWKAVLKEALKQGGIEATTEELNYLGGVLAEAYILREKSDYNVMVQNAMANGMSHEEAVRYADAQIIRMAGEVAAQSFFSGALTSATGDVINKVSEDNALKKQAKTYEQIKADVKAGRYKFTQNDKIAAQQQAVQPQTGAKDVAAQDVEQPALTFQEEVERQLRAGKQEQQKVPETELPALTFQEEVERQLRGEKTVTEEPISFAEKIRRADNEINGGINYAVSTGTQIAAADSPTGNGVSDGSGQRTAGVGTREQAGGMAGSTGGTAVRTATTNAGTTIINRQNHARSLRQQGLIREQSSKELGIPNGTNVQNLMVLPQEQYDEELQSVASRLKTETGKDVTFVVGKIQVKTKGGVKNVRGVRTSDALIVQADNATASATQIADHEAFHDKMASWGLLWSVRQYISENYSEEEFREVVSKYIKAMEGIVDIRDGDSYEDFIALVEEEMMADAYAGIDYRGFEATKFTDAVNKFMDQKGRGKGQQQANGVRQTNAPPAGQNENTVTDDGVRYSLDDVAVPTREELESKPPVAVIDISKAQTKGTFAQRRKQILQNAEQVISKPYLNRDTGVMIFLTEKSYTHAFNNIGEIQLNAAEHIPEFIENAVLTHAENNTHGSDYATGVYTFFAAAKAERVLPVKLKVKEYKYAGQDLPQNIKAFFENEPQGYAASYDTVVLELEEIEESSTGSAKDMNPKDPFQGPAELSEISVADLLDLVKGDSEKYIPKRDTTRYSLDDSDYEKVDAQKAAEMKQWEEMWLKDRLSDEGYKQYREWKAQQEAQKKADQRLKEKEKQKVATNRRKLQKEYRDSVTDAAMQKKLAKNAKPTQAKKELRVSLLDMFSIPSGSRAEVAEVIDSFADRMLQKGTLTEEDRKAFFDRMYASGAMTVPADEYMAIGREIIHKGKIYVSDNVRSEMGDDWNDLRRRAFAAGVYLTDSRTDAGIDQWNRDLAEMLPGLFDSEDTDLRSILERIVQVAEEGRDEQVSLAEYTAQLAGEQYVSEDEVLDSMERDMDIALRVFAKTAGMEIKLKEQTIRRQAALTKENYRQRLQMAQERQERKEMSRRQQEQKELREMQQKTLKALQWLNKNRRRAPEELKADFDKVLSDIDIYAVGAANEMRWSDKYGATWKDIVDMYDHDRKENPNFLPNPELERLCDRLRKRKLEDMDVEDLHTLFQAAVALRTDLYNRRNVMLDEKHRLFADVFTDVKKEITAAKGKRMGGVNDLFNKDQLSAMNVLERMAGWNPNSAWYSMAQQLERGERDVRAFTIKANRMLEEFLTEHEEWVKKADGQGKDGIWYPVEVPRLEKIGLDGKPIFGETVTVYMTPAQKVHLYLESKNYDNLLHMAGGRAFADKELYSKGKRAEAFSQGQRVKLAPETVKALVSDLTAEELELARILEQYYNVFAKGEINRVSNILYGYDKAIHRNYAPIYTDQNFTSKEFGLFDNRAEHVGNLKERIRSKTPTLNLSAFDAFERHVDRTALFVGMAIPTQNWNTLWGWQDETTSTKEIVEKKWGKEAISYIDNLVTELQGGSGKKEETWLGKVGKKLKGNYISGVFGFNWGIALKQWGSVPLAGVYLGYRNAPNPLAALTVDRKLVAKYTQDLDWRSMGYSMPETKFLKENPNKLQSNKTAQFLFGGGQITASDAKAASTLWAWAEKKIRKEQPELELGTREQIEAGQSPFYKKVAEEFENAVARSQSTSDKMHQSTLRKSDAFLPEMLTLFGSDSAQTYNALRQAIGEARHGGKKGAGAVGRVVVAALTNTFWSAGISCLMAMWKNRGKAYRDDEDELTAESIWQKIGMDMFKSFAGIAVGGEELADLIGAIMLKERWYGVENMEGSVLQDLLSLCYNAGTGIIETIGDLSSVAESGGDLGEYFKRNHGAIAGAVKDAAIDIAGFLGIPAANVEAYLMGTLKLIPGVEAVYDDVFTTPTKSSLDSLTGVNLEIGVGNVFAVRGVETSSDAEKVLASLYEEGYKDVIPSNTPTTVSVDGESHKLSAYQQQVYDKAWSAIVGAELDDVVTSDVFQEADPEKQEKMLKTLYSYAADEAKAELFEDLEGSGRADDIAAFEEAGLDMADYLGAVADDVSLEKFLQGINNGLNPEDVADLVDAIEELEPLEGAVQVADVQRWRVCVDAYGNPDFQLAALATYMTDSQFAKAKTANDFDVNLDSFVKLYEIRAEFNADGNKSYSHTEYKAAIDSLGLGKRESAVLWQLITGAKSAKNNPYNASIGQQVIDSME